MAVIDTLTVNLAAQTAGLSKGLKQGTSLISNFANTLKGPLGQISALFAGAFSVNAFKDFVSNALDAADEMEHIAESVGVTAEAFNQLRHAAALTDTTQAQLVSGLEKMEKTLGEAGQGSEKASEAFTQIGLSVEALERLTPEQQFKMIATAIASIKDPSEKAAAAVDIFGKSGQKLIPLLNEGEKGLNELGEEVKGAFNEENRAGIKAANDAIDVMNEAFKSMAHETAIALAPTVKEIAEVFKEWLKTLKEIIALFRMIDAPPDVGPPVPGAPSRGWFEGVNWAEVLTRVLTGNASSVGGLLGAGAAASQDQMREAVKQGMAEAVAALKALASRPDEPGVEL
jgi:hypothetical protein